MSSSSSSSRAAHAPLVAVEVAVALGERALADAAQLDDRRLVAVGEVRIAVAELLGQVELEPLGELARSARRRHGRRQSDRASAPGGQKDGLVVAAPLPLAALERGAAADGDEHVLERGAAAVVGVDVAGRDRLDAERLGELAQPRVPARVAALVRALQLDVEAVAAEGAAQAAPPRSGRAPRGRRARSPRGRRAPRSAPRVAPGRAAAGRLAVRRVARVRVRRGQQPAEVRVAARALHEQA